jgi:hypothetical protein
MPLPERARSGDPLAGPAGRRRAREGEAACLSVGRSGPVRSSLASFGIIEMLVNGPAGSGVLGGDCTAAPERGLP